MAKSEYFKHITQKQKDFYDRTWPMNFCINRSLLFLGFDGIVKAETNRHYIAPNGTTAINFITVSGTASVILIRQ